MIERENDEDNNEDSSGNLGWRILIKLSFFGHDVLEHVET